MHQMIFLERLDFETRELQAQSLNEFELVLSKCL